MLRKFALLFGTLALMMASAATYKVTLLQPSVLNGNQLKAGEYRLNIGDSQVTITQGKKSIEVPVKVENVQRKFDNTAVRYTEQDGKSMISEILLGGTTTKLVFHP